MVPFAPGPTPPRSESHATHQLSTLIPARLDAPWLCPMSVLRRLCLQRCTALVADLSVGEFEEMMSNSIRKPLERKADENIEWSQKTFETSQVGFSAMFKQGEVYCILFHFFCQTPPPKKGPDPFLPCVAD